MVIYPAFSYISGITNSQYAVVTFTSNHDFTDGEIVSFRVQPPFGMVEINNLHGLVLTHNVTTITVNIDTTTWTAFDYSQVGTTSTAPPVCVPSSSGIIPYSNPATMNLQDAFDNRSS